MHWYKQLLDALVHAIVGGTGTSNCWMHWYKQLLDALVQAIVGCTGTSNCWMHWYKQLLDALVQAIVGCTGTCNCWMHWYKQLLDALVQAIVGYTGTQSFKQRSGSGGSAADRQKVRGRMGVINRVPLNIRLSYMVDSLLYNRRNSSVHILTHPCAPAETHAAAWCTPPP